MFRLAQQRSSTLCTPARWLTSIINQHGRCVATKMKAVVFNMGGSLVPATWPVISKYARQHRLTEVELTSKLFVDGDKEFLDEISPALLSRHGSIGTNLAHVLSAINSIRGEGIKTALITDAPGLNPSLIPVGKDLFDFVSPKLNLHMLSILKVDPHEVVYLDNKEVNLKAAELLGMSIIDVDNVEKALIELESKLKVPLKEFIPGFTWIFWDNANNPYSKSIKENILYYFLCLYFFMVSAHLVLKYVLKIDGTFQH